MQLFYIILKLTVSTTGIRSERAPGLHLPAPVPQPDRGGLRLLQGEAPLHPIGDLRDLHLLPRLC